MPERPPSAMADRPRLKRSFTLPRNPFRRTPADLPKALRRPSVRRLLDALAQRLGAPAERAPAGLQTWRAGATPAVTGLKNHGNTCFINAVLQCVSHTDVLAEYFVLDRYRADLARRNKLNSKKFGTRGELTEQLATVLKALWACEYSPELSSGFKQVVERHGSQYKGNQQHDAHEFFQWLLDKVHEDLNTASKRKYKSIKTSGRPDEIIAAETLENYKRCNNSFIQGVFQAQYRSSLSCSRCRTQSNTFDPFLCISVQLPQFSKQSIYVTVLYTSQQPRQVQIGLSLPTAATISELRHCLESDTSIPRSTMLLTEITDATFHRTFADPQPITILTEIDPIFCIEAPALSPSPPTPYLLLAWINVRASTHRRFGSPYAMHVPRETAYDDLQKLILKEMAAILHGDVLETAQPHAPFAMRVFDPVCDDSEPACYLDSALAHPLFVEAIDQALALCSEDGGPPHVKLVLEWDETAKEALIYDDGDVVEEHFTVKQLRAQALQGGAPLTLEECLRDYTEAETLTDGWRCPHCQQYQPVVKTLDMWTLPDILVVHFKRFRQQSIRGGNSAKLTTMVDFPVHSLDMSPHLATNNRAHLVDDAVILPPATWSPFKRTRKTSTTNDNLYDLYGVCYHHGTDIETGHYTAACKNPFDSKWYLYDDAKVTNLSNQTDDIAPLLVNSTAYILFYQRRQVDSSCASSSSSSSEHWISRMPKFQPPKHVKLTENKQVDEQPPLIDNTENEDDLVLDVNETIELRNSENCQNGGGRIVTAEMIETEIQPLHTTSIYIKANGDVDIVDRGSKKLDVDKSEVRNVYTTTASVHRYSDGVTASRPRLNWMSPQPCRKLNQSQQSM